MTTVEHVSVVATVCYQDNYDHLVDELRKLDLLIQRRVLALQLETQSMPEVTASQHVYISHAEVDWLLSRNGSREVTSHELAAIDARIEGLQREIDAQVSLSRERGVPLALPELAERFGLSPFELQTVIVCLAPELRRKYDRLYAYLQDDITRKRPSVDLALDLLCETEAERWAARTAFCNGAPLFKAGILHTTDDPQSPSGSSGLAQFLKLDPRILNFILGNNGLDGRLQGRAKLLDASLSLDHVLVDPAITTQVRNWIQRYASEPATDQSKLVLYLHGPYGAGKRDLARAICGELNCRLLYLDLALLLARESDVEDVLRLIVRESLLLQAGIYVDHVDSVFRGSDRGQALAKVLAELSAEYGRLAFLAGARPWFPHGIFEHAVFQAVEVPVPGMPLREAAWQQALGAVGLEAETGWAGQLARQFALTPGQIRDAAAFAAHRRTMCDAQAPITLVGLYTACRSQSNQQLGELAVKIEPHYGWDDIILPEDKQAQLREICSQVKHQYRVFDEWGFGRKLAHGKGLSALFTGPPGTGKTMAAEIIAHELGLDLYKIDLSSVVSKYIGETEKNLARIFHEAETSNAILFFDEADALFGKRTQVSDAHDRYANIETSYLLQKMEEYEGVVILATNLRENMDAAFTRRIRFIVEFPFPDAASRTEIWKTHFPSEAPVSDDVDYEFLGKRLQIAGGNIKNIALNAAFLAADDGNVIDMEHILRGSRREYEKIGRLWNEREFAGTGE